ncbi:YncE family protein [Chitinophaga varians]|uniref:YncE family protein n=1 Tax=Chitinophaga varians TaxID=2202339 RepID=A0A847RUC0_9BACT|nr:YncE family protein [Chitinophaga varians]NLR62961.1 YncE family protein [Chitinophaga varians]
MKKLLLPALLFTVMSTSAQTSTWHVSATYPVKGDGKWDYIAVSPVTQQLYVAHGTEVNILDKATGAEAGVIPHTTGVHGIAFAVPFGKGFTSNGKLNTVTVFDLHNNQVQGEIPVGGNPDAILFEPFSDKVITCNGASKDLSIINPNTQKVVATVPLQARPETAVSDGKGRLFVNLEDKSRIAVVNMATFKVEKEWPLGKGEAPTGLAIDTVHHRLFAGCDNKLMIVLDEHDGRTIATLPIGDGCDGVAFDAAGQLVFASNGEGNLSVYHQETADKYKLVAHVPTAKGAKTLTVDPLTHTVFLPVADRQAAGADGKAAIAPGTFRVLAVSK